MTTTRRIERKVIEKAKRKRKSLRKKGRKWSGVVTDRREEHSVERTRSGLFGGSTKASI